MFYTVTHNRQRPLNKDIITLWYVSSKKIYKLLGLLYFNVKYSNRKIKYFSYLFVQVFDIFLASMLFCIYFRMLWYNDVRCLCLFVYFNLSMITSERSLEVDLSSSYFTLVWTIQPPTTWISFAYIRKNSVTSVV